MSFDKPESVVAQPKPAETETEKSSVSTDDRRAIAKAKAKYVYPWWASENPLEVFWGQLHEEIWIIPVEKFLETAKQAMGRQVLKQEFSDRPALADEFLERTPEAARLELFAKFPAQKAEFADNKYAAN